MASLLLCGAVSAQHFEADAHAHDNNMPVVAQVVLDGDAVTTGGYELGAFIGDDVRGSAQIQLTLDNTYWIQVYYSTETEENPAATVTFKLYDENGEDEYTAETTLTIDPEGYGTPGTPQVIEFATVQTQSVPMASGWSWWSSYIELGDNALTQLENGLGSNGDQILSRTDGYANRNEYMGYIYWSGNLTSIHNEQMYMIQTNAACNVDFSGQRASLADHPITIYKDWNWIGFPSSQSMSITDALQSFTPEAGDQIKGRSGYATYSTYGSYGWWSGSLNTMNPGQGYMYLSNSDDPKTLTYQAASKTENLTANTTNSNYFQPKSEPYANNMTITAVIDLDGKELRSEDYEVAAFVGDQCRGSIKLMYIEPIDRYEAFLLVFGEVEEALRFVLTDGTEVSWSNDHLMYNIDDVIGSTIEPIVLHFGPLGIEDNYQTKVNVYPNPSDNVFNVEGKGIQKIEVIDNYGQIILSKEINNDFVQINLSDRASGAYLLRIITNNGITTNKLIKK